MRDSIGDIVEAKHIAYAHMLEAYDIAIAEHYARAPRRAQASSPDVSGPTVKGEQGAPVPSAPPPSFGGGHRGPGSEPSRNVSAPEGASANQVFRQGKGTSTNALVNRHCTLGRPGDVDRSHSEHGGERFVISVSYTNASRVPHFLAAPRAARALAW